MSATIWHNPRCSKSRQTLALIDAQRVPVKIFPYTKQIPTADQIADVLRLLDIPAIELMRTGERLFKELGLSKTDADDVLIKAMVENPILIERPIVIANGKAAIGRPPENVLDIL
ncbi:arsenate reductase (glutaredoxin) [Amylibacter kogurei]|uniref:Arsenate reductase n=1 Tax=Paramylibacter kogurei TaxID=1889778 RepID=A0A2G5K8N4_9RHOB|nr:arsenate reductase (glutaredoxin) [Amylibacter kogurei]PIB25898.1 arsenate reductase (glutaredoxin) [Amylibacter kogurei]